MFPASSFRIRTLTYRYTAAIVISGVLPFPSSTPGSPPPQIACSTRYHGAGSTLPGHAFISSPTCLSRFHFIPTSLSKLNGGDGTSEWAQHDTALDAVTLKISYIASCERPSLFTNFQMLVLPLSM
jgi:hypothetical protein